MKDIFKTRKCLTPEEISAYFQESLPEEELHSIEQHLLDCELCSAAVEGWSKVEHPEKVMATLEKTTLEFPADPPVELTRKKQKLLTSSSTIWIAAATIALIMSMLFFFNLPQNDPTVLYEKYYEPVTMPDPTTRNPEVTDIKELVSQAYKAYRQKDFGQSIPFFEQILLVDRKHPSALFYGGLAYLETGQYQKAIKALDKLASQPGAQFADDANWYLALALLRNNDMERCREVLSGIARNDGYFASKASELVEMLDGL